MFFVSDNGTPPAAVDPENQSSTGVKRTTFEEGIRVPFFAAGEGVGQRRLTGVALPEKFAVV